MLQGYYLGDLNFVHNAFTTSPLRLFSKYAVQNLKGITVNVAESR